MKKIIYAEIEADNKWRFFLQEAYDSGENTGSVRWMDPGKVTYDTEAEAITAGYQFMTDSGLNGFIDAVPTDFRQGRVDILVKGGMDMNEAYLNEKSRVETAGQ